MAITHSFVSAKSDGGDATVVRPSDWNAAHTVDSLAVTGTAHAGSTALISALPDSGSSSTKTFDNGTMVIDADVGTGSFPLTIKYNGSSIWRITAGGNVEMITGELNLGSGVVVVDSTSIRLFEVAAPSGVANTARIYAVDNGSGKTRLMCIFGSGAAVQLAIEP